jgi:hypothetical protein
MPQIVKTTYGIPAYLPLSFLNSEGVWLSFWRKSVVK